MRIGIPYRLALGTGLVCSCAAGARRATLPDPDRADRCVVARVVDGDTFACRDGRKVRLIGMDSPERGQGAAGRLARQSLTRLLPPGHPVRLEADVAARDRFGRDLAYAWVGKTLVNEVMIRDGWAVLYTLPPNVKYADRLRRAQKEARERAAGLWSSGGFDCLPRTWRRGACGRSP